MPGAPPAPDAAHKAAEARLPGLLDEMAAPLLAPGLAGELARLEGKQLKPGMPAEAFIQTDARSPLSYLLKPLQDQIEYAWRER